MKLKNFSRLCLFTAALTMHHSAFAENASNPLAAVTNTDVRMQYLKDDKTGTNLNDVFVDGAFMVNPKFKLKYELHYWETNLTGRSEHDWSHALVKGIYFPTQGAMKGGTKYKVAVGMDYIYDFDNIDKGIGAGTDQIAPFAGLAFALNSGISVVPLLQHFEGIDSGDFSVTSARLIGIKPLEGGRWLKLDLKVPYDWDREVVPADAEIQFGGYLRPKLAMYVDGKVGLGSDRVYDWGLGVGIRFNY